MSGRRQFRACFGSHTSGWQGWHRS
jgi:hypothetical protein